MCIRDRPKPPQPDPSQPSEIKGEFKDELRFDSLKFIIVGEDGKVVTDALDFTAGDLKETSSNGYVKFKIDGRSKTYAVKLNSDKYKLKYDFTFMSNYHANELKTIRLFNDEKKIYEQYDVSRLRKSNKELIDKALVLYVAKIKGNTTPVEPEPPQPAEPKVKAKGELINKRDYETLKIAISDEEGNLLKTPVTIKFGEKILQSKDGFISFDIDAKNKEYRLSLIHI